MHSRGLANQIRRRLPAAGDKWHLDEVVLDILLQSRRDTHAAKRLQRKLMKRQCRVPRAARRVVMLSVEHRKHKGLNNRAENSRSGRDRGTDLGTTATRLAGAGLIGGFGQPWQ